MTRFQLSQPRIGLFECRMQSCGLISVPGLDGVLPKRIALFLTLDVLADGLAHEPMRAAVPGFGKALYALFNLGVNLDRYRADRGCCHRFLIGIDRYYRIRFAFKRRLLLAEQRWRSSGLTAKLVIYLVTFGSAMQAWPVQDAKARFSEFLDACIADGPQLVTKRGAEAAVLVPVNEWRRLQAAARPCLKQLLLSDEGRGDLLVPPRGSARRRKVSAAG